MTHHCLETPPPLMLLLLVLLQLQQPASASILSCGFCICERSSISCNFDTAKDSIRDRYRDGISLEQFVPTSADLRAHGQEPDKYEDLYVNCKNSLSLQNQRLTRALLSGLVNLKKVAIIRCHLTDIDSDAFRDLRRLEDFDATDNNLGLVPAGTFQTLNMTQLKLSENKQLRLVADSFAGLTVERLILSRCELADFPAEELQRVRGLRELVLSDNRIRYVPNSALLLIRQLRLFYLDNNPLACTCANKWLRESVNWNALSPIVSTNSKLPTCKSPFNLMDIELTKVEPSKFRCSPPRLTAVSVSLTADSALLSCAAQAGDDEATAGGAAVASGGSQPLPWFYQQPLQALSDFPGAVPPPAGRGPQFSRRLVRSAGLASERFNLRVADTDGQSVDFNLTIVWPPRAPPPQPEPPEPPQLPSEASATAESPAGIPEKTTRLNGYYGQKQFTLVEMIVAVIGTFMATSLVFLLSCQFVRWYKRRDKKRWATYTGQQHQQYSATYNYNPHPGSSHEYDVPRIDQPCLPKPPPPPPTTMPPPPGGGSSVSSSDREFLDYNNPRLMYNV